MEHVSEYFVLVQKSMAVDLVCEPYAPLTGRKRMSERVSETKFVQRFGCTAKDLVHATICGTLSNKISFLVQKLSGLSSWKSGTKILRF